MSDLRTPLRLSLKGPNREIAMLRLEQECPAAYGDTHCISSSVAETTILNKMESQTSK